VNTFSVLIICSIGCHGEMLVTQWRAFLVELDLLRVGDTLVQQLLGLRRLGGLLLLLPPRFFKFASDLCRRIKL
jgi:hypothetical protein